MTLNVSIFVFIYYVNSNKALSKAPVLVPLPIPGLVSKRVMVLEFIEGVPLSKVAKEMSARGILPGSPESILLGTYLYLTLGLAHALLNISRLFLGQKLLTSLTDAYSNMIFGSGIIHGDPHPGNIFVMEGGEIALLDCGQVKMLKNQARLSLAELVVLVNLWEVENKKSLTSAATLALQKQLSDKVKSFGVSFTEDAGEEAAAAVAILLFGNTGTALPGNNNV